MSAVKWETYILSLNKLKSCSLIGMSHYG